MQEEENVITETEELLLTDKKIFTEIWFSPRKVFKYLNDNDHDYWVTLLLILGGITSAFSQAATRNMGDRLSLIWVIVSCVIGGALFGWISYYISAALLSWTGGWLHGKGNTHSLLTMLSHSLIPSITTLIITAIEIGLIGNGVFQSNSDFWGDGIVTGLILVSLSVLELILGIWTLVLGIIGNSEVQKFSVWKSILNIILAASLVLIPLAIIVVLVGNY
jgi:hypothetical protein